MKAFRITPILLSLLLQFAPICKYFQTASPLASAPIAIVFQWIVGATVVAGTYDAVSGASVPVKILSPTTAKGTNGVPFLYLITQNSTYTDLGHRFEAEPLPPGLTVKTVEGNRLPAYGVISGTPQVSGVYQVTLRAKFEDDHHPNEPFPTTNLTLTIIGPPSISVQPNSTSAEAGGSIQLSVTAHAAPAPTYAWRRNETLLEDQTNSVLTLDPVTIVNAGDYTVIVRNEFGSVTSSPPARVTVTSTEKGAEILSHPASSTVLVGTSWTASATVTGTEPILHQWFKNGQSLTEATGPSFTLSSVTTADAGSYHLVVGNSVSSGIESQPAVLRVIGAPSILSSHAAEGRMHLVFHAELGATYLLQSADTLNSAEWSALGDPLSPTATGHAEFTDPTPAANRFYRIQVTVP